MIFTFLHQREKKWLLLFLACLFSWWLFSAQAICSASGTQTPVPEEKTYTVTEVELQGLDSRLERLGQLSETQRLESMRLQAQLTKSAEQLRTLQTQLVTSTAQLQQAQSSLLSANQLLEQYAAAAKKERLRIKAQRNTWLAVALVAATVAIVK